MRRAEAAAAARRRKIRQRIVIAAVAVAVPLGVIIAKAMSGHGKSTASSSTTTTTTKAAGSVAGKPCVAMQGTPPAGAPSVPVKVGPPPTKLVTEDLKPGSGPVVNAGDTLSVNYVGVSCSTGKIFDSSYSRGQPADFPLSGVIPGWQQGIPGMRVGGQRLLGIPPAQGYGAAGSPPDIAPDETLWFVVEVVSAKAA